MAKRKTKTRKQTLTALRVAKALKERGRFRDTEVKGLLLCVASETNASWALRYQLRGVEHMLGLGSAREFGIKAARERALAARRLLADKVNPLSVKRERAAAEAEADAKTLTFRAAAQQYFDQHAPDWSNEKHRSQFTSSMKRFVYPIIGDLPVADIARRLCCAFWSSRSLPTIALTCRQATFGRHGRQPPAEFGTASSGCSIGRPCAAIVRATIRQDGKAS